MGINVLQLIMKSTLAIIFLVSVTLSFAQVTLPRDDSFPVVFPGKSSETYGAELFKVILTLNRINLDTMVSTFSSLRIRSNDSLIVEHEISNVKRYLAIAKTIYSTSFYTDSVYDDRKKEWSFYTNTSGKRTLAETKIMSIENLVGEIQNFDFNEKITDRILITYNERKKVIREQQFNLIDGKEKIYYDLNYIFDKNILKQIQFTLYDSQLTKVFNHYYSSDGTLFSTHHEMVDSAKSRKFIEIGKFYYDANSKRIERIELMNEGEGDTLNIQYKKNDKRSEIIVLTRNGEVLSFELSH